MSAPTVRHDCTLLGEQDLYLFNEGSHFRLYQKLGAHHLTHDGEAGTQFAVWAPNAHAVFVYGDFNGWDKWSHPLKPRGGSGIWEGFVPGVYPGSAYKYFIESNWQAYKVEKADPLAQGSETPPLTASRVAQPAYDWRDADWMAQRAGKDWLKEPMSVYEVHLGSWRRGTDNRWLGYREMAQPLAQYCADLGYTHVELLPVMEHPFYGSWGYQTTGYFTPSARFGDAADFKYLVDALHQAGVGVILDWVPSHFPLDAFGLSFFDGTHLYEHADKRKGHHPDWDSAIYNYGRKEVQSFLISSAFYWLDQMHADGLRVDAVASMLYLDYSRKEGEWIPNQYGGNENLEAVEFLRRFNKEVYGNFPGVVTIAEESTAWPMVSKPVYVGGLGFGFKWDMGWMHDTLEYFTKEPVHRKFHHRELTFRGLYAHTENFVLALSHDEVVHGKGSLLRKMPGDDWQKFANLRLLLAWQFGQNGKKLMFMGGEIAQWNEWWHETQLDWNLLDYPTHRGVQSLARDLNHLYRAEPALHRLDSDPQGFSWVDCSDSPQSVVEFLRLDGAGQVVLCCYNFTPVPREGYRVGVPAGGWWSEVLNTDAVDYGGSGVGNAGGMEAQEVPHHGRTHSLLLTLPPLGAVWFKHQD